MENCQTTIFLIDKTDIAIPLQAEEKSHLLEVSQGFCCLLIARGMGLEEELRWSLSEVHYLSLFAYFDLRVFDFFQVD
jgi:hypothetical protein